MGIMREQPDRSQSGTKDCSGNCGLDVDVLADDVYSYADIDCLFACCDGYAIL